MSRTGTPAGFEEQAKLFASHGGLWLDYRHCDQPYIAERGIGRYARALVSELRAVDGLQFRLIEDSGWPPVSLGLHCQPCLTYDITDPACRCPYSRQWCLELLTAQMVNEVISRVLGPDGMRGIVRVTDYASVGLPQEVAPKP